MKSRSLGTNWRHSRVSCEILDTYLEAEERGECHFGFVTQDSICSLLLT